jgi:hypothetical protein
MGLRFPASRRIYLTRVAGTSHGAASEVTPRGPALALVRATYLWDGLRVLRYYGPRVPSPVRALRPIRGYRVPPSALQPPLEPVYAPTAILSTLPRT